MTAVSRRSRVAGPALGAALAVAALAPAVAQTAGEAGALRAKEAATALARNQADKAVELYTQALADQGLPNDRRASVLNDRGVAHSRLGQAKSAIEDFNRAVQLAPGREQALASASGGRPRVNRIELIFGADGQQVVLRQAAGRGGRSATFTFSLG